MKQITLNIAKKNLTTRDVINLTTIIGKGCRQKTKDRIASCLTYSSSRLPNYGIFDRLMFEDFEWSYCAGQDYRAEIKTIRELIIKGVY